MLAALEAAPEDEISQDVKDRLGKMAQALAIDDAPDDDPSEDKSHTQDPPLNLALRRELFELQTDDIARKAPPPAPVVEPVDLPPDRELRRQVYDLMLETVSGEETV